MFTKVPERISQCACYFSNGRLAGTGVLTPAPLSRPTSDVHGAGIAGTISTPTRGNLESRRATIAFRVATPELAAVFSAGVHTLEFRAVIQGLGPLDNPVESLYSSFMRVMAVSWTPGTVDNGAEMGGTAEFEVLDELTTIDGLVLYDISKTNNVMMIRNELGVLVDELATVRAWLGV